MCGLLSLQFYKPYFDVDTSEVKARLVQAAWPLRKTSPPFLGGESESGSSKVDLYGPVWVSKNSNRQQTDGLNSMPYSLYLSTAVHTAVPHICLCLLYKQ